MAQSQVLVKASGLTFTATACKAGTLKYRLIIPASGGLIRSLQPESLLLGRLAPVLCPEQFLPGFLQKRGQTGW